MPLCGDTCDIAYIADQHADVIGVEFVETAAKNVYTGDDSAPLTDAGKHGAYFVVSTII